MSTLFIVAGPNGCGKSTLTRALPFDGVPVIDPDAIARSLERDSNTQAARMALRQRRAALRARESFLVETTLTGPGILRLMTEARNAGYRIELHYLCVGSPAQALERICSRVAQGGHDIPERDARRRFARSLRQLPNAIARADETWLHDNAKLDRPHEHTARITAQESHIAQDAPDWTREAVRNMHDKKHG